jgi:hypothetical protein
MRGSNPVRCCSAVRGRSRGRPVACDPYWPTVTARAHRGPAVPGAVRTQCGPVSLRNGRRPIRSYGAAVSALAIQLALIVPLESPAMQVEFAADPVEPVAEAGHGLLPRAVPSSRPQQCASARELSPGQLRRRARSASSCSREGRGSSRWPLPCQGPPGACGDLRRWPNVACELGGSGTAGDRCCPLRSGRLWPGCGPAVASPVGPSDPILTIRVAAHL